MLAHYSGYESLTLGWASWSASAVQHTDLVVPEAKMQQQRECWHPWTESETGVVAFTVVPFERRLFRRFDCWDVRFLSSAPLAASASASRHPCS